MRIAVVGANSTLGRRVVVKAEERGIFVTGMMRTAELMVGNGPLVIKDYHDLQPEDIEGCHVVVDTVSFPHIDHYSTELLPVWRLLEIMKGSPAKLLCIGSCAFLYTDKSRTAMMLDDGALCNDNGKNQLRQCVNAYLRLRENRDVNWSVLCPPLVMDRRGYGTGKFKFGDDVFPLDLDGTSSITMTDLAAAVIELLLRGVPVMKCVSVSSVRT